MLSGDVGVDHGAFEQAGVTEKWSEARIGLVRSEGELFRSIFVCGLADFPDLVDVSI